VSDWRHDAACLDSDPELFFPIGTTGGAVDQIEEAKDVCRRCPVAETCLQWALDTAQDAGVWGGLSEDERRALKRRNGRARRAGKLPKPEPAPKVPPAREPAVPAAPYVEILDLLGAAGWTRQRLAVGIGLSRHAIDAIVLRRHKSMFVSTAQAIETFAARQGVSV
jgi:WhiB family transcriptional regulator, redox-sensing transcriptional regulator